MALVLAISGGATAQAQSPAPGDAPPESKGFTMPETLGKPTTTGSAIVVLKKPTALANNGGLTGLVGVTMPAGRWLVSNTVAVNPDPNGDTNIIHCANYTANAQGKLQATTIFENGPVGNAGNIPNTNRFAFLVANLSFQGVLTLTKPTLVLVACNILFPSSGGANEVVQNTMVVTPF